MNVLSISIIFITGVILGWMLSSVSSSPSTQAAISAKELETILRAYDLDRGQAVLRGSYSRVVSDAAGPRLHPGTDH